VKPILPFVLVLLTLALRVGRAEAQVPDLAELGAQHLPGVPVSPGRPTRAQVSSYDLSLNAPIPVAKKSYLIPGIQYHVDSVSYSSTEPGFARLGAFHSVTVPVLFVQLLPHDWSLSLRVAPGLAGDFHKLESRALTMSALGLATHSFSERLVFGGGAIASYGFGRFLPLPAVYLDWKPINGLDLEMFLPAFATLKYTFKGRVEVGIRADVQGNSYAVSDPRIVDAWPCARDPASGRDPEPSECFDHLAYSVVSTGGTLGVRIFSSVWATGFFGSSVYRRFEPMGVDNRGVMGGGDTLPNALSVRAGLVWRIPEH
jgi:hypothetical protein